MTGEQMCDTIAWVHCAVTGETVDPEAIWRSSPSGELWPVVEMFDQARVWIAAHLDGERLVFDMADNGDFIEYRLPL